MAQKTKIFISHSAHQDADKEILKQLVSRLKDKEFKVYCDQDRLKIGDEWRQEIYSAIGCCHAAVVLVTKEALDIVKHPWVFKECSMLTLVKGKNTGFPIFPVAMNGVTAKDIDESPIDVLQLNEIQLGSYKDLDSLIDRITERLCTECSDEDEPLYHHHKRIEAHLRLVSDDESLKEAIEFAQSDLDDWDPLEKKLRYRLARVLLTLNADRIIDTLGGVFPILREKPSERLIYYLAPFWLDLPAIARLDNVVQNEQKLIQASPKLSEKTEHPVRTAFGLNASEPLTALLHASRAGYLRKIPYTVITPAPDAGTDEEGRFASHIISEINARSGQLHKSGSSLDDLMIELAKDRPIFVVLPYGTDKNVVNNLRKRFWPFIFIVLTAQDAREEWNLSKFNMLEPPLEEGVEDQASLLIAKTIMGATTIIRGS
ncbi:MAG TPA: toll/interleukin-1 receptor domain-containing protein [Pyrinomonadaceae bacterium]|nr:toll/interleukin-1 receptor domain-containing protein [Pyrinomonadaceae bacterium]